MGKARGVYDVAGKFANMTVGAGRPLAKPHMKTGGGWLDRETLPSYVK